jgi:hypothetical protein
MPASHRAKEYPMPCLLCRTKQMAPRTQSYSGEGGLVWRHMSSTRGLLLVAVVAV